MTTDSGAPQAAPAPGGFKEGIYLENKKGNIGTGGTAKKAEYRSFWATASVGEASALMILLDDAFKPTPIAETFSLSTLTEPTWVFVAEGEQRYQQLRPILDQMLAAYTHAHDKHDKGHHDHHHEAHGAGKWWEGGSHPDGPPANPFELDKSKKAALPTPKKGGWWDK
jgi:hypothetical protein